MKGEEDYYRRMLKEVRRKIIGVTLRQKEI